MMDWKMSLCLSLTLQFHTRTTNITHSPGDDSISSNSDVSSPRHMGFCRRWEPVEVRVVRGSETLPRSQHWSCSSREQVYQ